MHQFESDLERRLRALGDSGTPDWADVRLRVRGTAPRRPGWRLAAAAAAALVLLALAAVASGVGSRVLDWLSLSESDERIPGPVSVAHVTGDRLYLPGRAPVRLTTPLFAPLLGMEVPLAVRSPDRRYVAYHGAPDAQSVAWGERIAFVRGGRVVVADGPHGRADVWTAMPSDYRVAAWAGGVLLVEDVGVHALDGPGRMRPLSIDSVAAVSPDGRAVVGTHLPVRGQDSPSSIVHVDDVRTGETIASVDLMRAAGERAPRRWLRAGIQSAAWRGNTIVGVSSFGSVSTIVVLRLDGSELRLRRVLRLDDAARAGGRDSLFFSSPVFTGAGTRRVLVQLHGPLGGRRYLVASVSCDLASSSCTQGRRTRRPAWSAVVDNPSRPLR